MNAGPIKSLSSPLIIHTQLLVCSTKGRNAHMGQHILCDSKIVNLADEVGKG